MNSRGFAILLVFAVAASIACGLIVERFTAPGFERTLWFAIGLAAILFPAGKYAEHRGWVKGVWKYGADRQPTSLAPQSPPAGSAADAAPTPHTTGGTAAPVTRPTSGESK